MFDQCKTIKIKQNSTTQIVTNLKYWNVKKKSTTQIVTKLKIYHSEK